MTFPHNTTLLFEQATFVSHTPTLGKAEIYVVELKRDVAIIQLLNHCPTLVFFSHLVQDGVADTDDVQYQICLHERQQVLG